MGGFTCLLRSLMQRRTVPRASDWAIALRHLVRARSMLVRILSLTLKVASTHDLIICSATLDRDMSVWRR